jgi:hypothetical protein
MRTVLCFAYLSLQQQRGGEAPCPATRRRRNRRPCLLPTTLRRASLVTRRRAAAFRPACQAGASTDWGK